MKRHRVVFAGTPEFALPTLEALAEHHHVPLVLSTPDKVRGRGVFSPTPVRQRAEELGLRTLAPENVNEPEVLEAIRTTQPDFIVEVAYGKLLKPEFLALTPDRVINVHPSLLPAWRGASPLVWPILAGETETGISIMLVDEGMDTGDVLLQTKYPLTDQTTASALHDDLSKDGAEALLEVLKNFAHYSENRIVQTGPHTYAKKLTREMGHLDFTDTGAFIDRKVRALNPWPGTYVFLGDTRIGVLAVERIPKTNASEPGIVYRADKTGIYCNSIDECIVLKTIKPAGKRAMEAGDYLLGNPLSVPTALS